MDPVKKRRCSDEYDDDGKRQKHDSKDNSHRNSSIRTLSLLEKLRQNHGSFKWRDSVLTGPCLLCNRKLSLSWYDWKHHFLEHTDEKQFYCSECNEKFSLKSEHTSCSDDTVIDVFGGANVCCALDGFICQLCDYFQINDYRLMDHFSQEHENLLEFNDIHLTRVTMVPDVRPEEHIIHTGDTYIPRKKRYRCGVGYCTFHGKTLGEYSDHVHKAHSVFKTFYCPHCKLLINRQAESTVAIQNVLTHIESHGNCLHQCVYCEQVVSTEAEIRAHIVDQHSDEKINFWRNIRVVDGVANSEKIEIVLDCALCGERVQNIPSAKDHFEEVHTENTIDFKSLKLIKATTPNLEVTCSIDETVLNYCEVLVCGMCTESFHNKHDWLVHFFKAHSSQMLLAKRDFRWLDAQEYRKKVDKDFNRNMLFFCTFCEDATGRKMNWYSTVDGVYRHWEISHKRIDKKPFRFHVAQLVACNYCNRMSTFIGLREHVAKSHPDESFVAIKAFQDSKQCALCEYTSDELVDHFETEHTLAVQSNVLNPVPLSRDDLLRLLHIAIHKKVKCEFCEEVFETRDEFHTHYSTKHPTFKKMACETFFDRDSIKLIGDCCHTQIEPNEFHDHLEYHKYTLKCEECSYRTTDAFHLMKHRVDVHEEANDVSTLYLNFLQLRYWRSELIFGNGLVVNKFNTQNTEYDYSRNFDSFAARVVAEKRNEYDRTKREISESD